jgi:prepilin-type N-terminal cleavage/methylation domain-containing protein
VSRRAAFTLIEMLAVVAIFALLVGIAIPSLSSLAGRQLRQEAERVAAQLDLARQRSVATGVPHRLVVDFDAAAYWLEWLVTESEARGEPPPPPEPEELDLSGATPLPLAAPRSDERDFRPLPGRLGRAQALESDVAFVGLEIGTSAVDRGQAYLAFERDGSADHAWLHLDDEAGHALAIEVLPLVDAARIVDAQP